MIYQLLALFVGAGLFILWKFYKYCSKRELLKTTKNYIIVSTIYLISFSYICNLWYMTLDFREIIKFILFVFAVYPLSIHIKLLIELYKQKKYLKMGLVLLIIIPTLYWMYGEIIFILITGIFSLWK